MLPEIQPIEFSQLQMTTDQTVDGFLKVLFIGEVYAGKTSIITRYLENNFLDNTYTTLGIDFKIKIHECNGTSVKLQLWDPKGGIDRFRAFTASYYKNQNGIFLCFDLSDEERFQHIHYWVKQILEFQGDNVCLFLIGNKSDLEIKIQEEKIFQLVSEYKFQYFQVSAKTGENVENALNSCFNQLIEKNKNKFGKEDDKKIGVQEEKNSSSCLVS
jgi:small GTP-binding protein